MNKRQIKAFSDAYDKIYDLNSAYGYEFKAFETQLEKEVKKSGYEFVLNQKSQKFKLVRCKE